MRPESADFVSVAIDVKGEKFLKKISLKNSVTEIIEQLIVENDLDGEGIAYGIRLTHSGNKKISQKYIDDANKQSLIQNGCELKLFDSPKIYLSSIFQKIYSNSVKDKRELGFNILNTELNDDLLLKIITELKWYVDICNKLTTDKSLNEFETMVCFNLIFKLLRRKYISSVNYDVVKIVIEKLKQVKRPNFTYSTLLLLRQLLLLSRTYFDFIVSEISILDDLMPILWNNELPLLQTLVLSFINVSIKLSKNEQKRTLIEIINRDVFRKTIFDYILSTNRKLSNELEKELHICQTYILSLYIEKFKIKVNLADEENIQLKYLNEDMSQYMNQNKFSRTISVFENESNENMNEAKNKFVLDEDYVENIGLLFDMNHLEMNDVSKLNMFSVDSWSTSQFNDLSNDDEESENTLQQVFSSESVDLFTFEEYISQLTIDCLVYFKQHYPQSFHIAMLEQNEHAPGFYKTSERILAMICSQMRIGQEPLKQSTSYCPLVFNYTEKPFIPEMFCRLIWLLIRTRVEMKAKADEDQEKVLTVLKKQFSMVLSAKSKTYYDCMSAMKSYSYSVISAIWQQEYKLKWKQILKTNKSVIDLSKTIEFDILNLIKENRIYQMQQGDKMLRIERDKKSKSNWIYMRLSPNRKELIINEWSLQYEICSFEKTVILVSDIKYLVVGNACQHVKEHRVKRPELSFSLLLDEVTYDFEITSDQIYDTWIDGINLLIGKTMSSISYHREKAQLLDVELTLLLLDVENVPLPNTPPPIPPLPDNFDFCFKN